MHGRLSALIVASATVAVAAAWAVGPVRAQPDPLRSAECRQALDALQVQESAAAHGTSAAASAAGGAPAARDADSDAAVAVATTPLATARPDAFGRQAAHPSLKASQRRAAIACLARRADSPVQASQPARSAEPRGLERPVEAQRLAQPPIAVAPIGMPPPPPSSLAPPAAPPKPVIGPAFILSCDAVGCWANDGSRLNRVGPDLWGGRGACSVQGTLLHCP